MAAFLFAEIIIPLALPKNYTWQVPPHMQDQLQVGSRVEVNLGKHKKYAGIVKSLHSEKPPFQPKEVLSILDAAPVVQAWQLQFWEWLARYYMCTEGEVMAASLPAHFKLSSETIIVFNESYGDDFSALDHDEYLLAEALLIKQQLKLDEAQQVLDTPHVYPVVNRLIVKKVCMVWESLTHTYKPRREAQVRLRPEYGDEEKLSALLNEWTRAPKQMELLLSFLHLHRTEGTVRKADLLKKSNASDAQLKGLVEKGILEVEQVTIDRIHYGPRDVQINFDLSPAQGAAWQGVEQAFAEKNICLLHGITSSGKTHIYVKLIEAEIKKGKQVLYMLPEIALTAQVIRRLQKHFGGYIGIYHSKFNQNERVEIWSKVQSGEIKVVLGARSSLFLPFQNLSLIICDEEHDASYKQQDPAPRYHGRDAAIYLASLNKAKVLLGSATPSYETYFNAQHGKYGFVKLSERFGDVSLPPIEIVDARHSARRGEKQILSTPLAEAIAATVAAERQAIIFQNRRGYAPHQVCMVCGWIAQCTNCDVSLTYHKLSNKLKCHYCGTAYTPLDACQACGSSKLQQRSFGTEKIEEIISAEVPGVQVARMDYDTVKNKNAHDILIQQFEQKRIDVLVGTQMVVKGLDFEHVDLVGIPDADGMLHFADFRVNERAFQLMEQVSGRAGRKTAGARVLVQTGQPQHPVLQAVMQHDYEGLYREELEKRKQFFYPPFSRIIHLHFKHSKREVVFDAAHAFADALKEKYEMYMVGPAEPVVNRVRSLYLMELMMKLPREIAFIDKCKQDVLKQVGQLQNQPAFRRVQVVADVDPQ